EIDHAAEIDRMDEVVRAEQRIAVGRSTCRLTLADRAGCAADIGDDDGLAEIFLQQRRERPEDHIGVAARRPRHDQLDGAVGIASGGCRAGQSQQQGGWQQGFRPAQQGSRFVHFLFLHGGLSFVQVPLTKGRGEATPGKGVVGSRAAYFNCSATLSSPACAQTSSWPGEPEMPTAPITSLPTLIGSPPASASTRVYCVAGA